MLVASRPILCAQAAGTKGRRYSMPNARIMLRQAMGGAQGSAFEVTITATELNHTNQARAIMSCTIYDTCKSPR